MILFLLFILMSNAQAFEDAAFKNTPYQYTDSKEYVGKQRYSEATLRNDPEVLVSTPNKPIVLVTTREDAMTPHMVGYDKDINTEVRVKSCVEYNGECKESDYFKATVKE